MKKTKCLAVAITLLLKMNLSIGQVTTSSDSLANPKDTSYVKGVNDAKIYYYKYREASQLTLVTTILTGPLGLIPAYATATKRPSIHRLGLPEPVLMRNTNYRMGYYETAFSIKKRAVWRNFYIGIVVFAVPAFIVYAKSQ